MKKGIILLMILIFTVSWAFAGSTTQEITTAKLRIEEIYNDGSVDLDEVVDLKRNEALVKSNAAITTDALPNGANTSYNRDSVTIGAGGSISGGYTSSITPFGTYYEDGQNQILFTAAELSAAGLPAGHIYGVGWNVSSASSQTMLGFNIEIKHTTATSVTGWETGFTNVYSGTHVAAAGWNDFTFTSSFVWDGTSNVLIKVCFDNDNYTTNSTVFYDTYTGMNGYSYNDNTAGCSDAYQNTESGRPQTRFEYPDPGDICDVAIAIGEVTDLPFDTSLATASGFGGYIPNQDLWYVFTAPGDGTIYVGTCGSSYDTVIAIWGECDVSTFIGYNDDSCGLQSELFNIPVVSGEDYYIQIGGYSSYSGPGILDVTFTTIPIITVNPLSMDEYLNVGETSTQILNIANSGSADLTFNLSHDYNSDTESTAPRNYGDYADRSRVSSSEINLPSRHPDSMRKGFSDNRAAGDVLGTYTGMPPANTGMVWVEDLLYVLNYDYSTLDVYDISTQSVTATYTIHSWPLGITWDGMYLWIGDGGAGNVFAYNLDGSSAGFSFSCPFSSYISLTWDGEYFIVNDIFAYDPVIYKLDETGTIIDSYTGSIGMAIYQSVWVPKHDSGNLWITYFENQMIAQLDLTDTEGTYALVSSFTTPPDYNSSYAITHHNFNLWWGDWDGPLYEIDDGIIEGWLNYDISSGTLAPGTNIDVTVTFDATDIYGGTYLADLTVNSNDPMTPQVIVPIMLDVTGEPDIDTDVVSIDFGPLLYGQYATDSFTISNVGTDWLDVSDIVYDNSSFTSVVVGSTTEDITIDVTVDYYDYEASWNVWNYTTSSYYFASNQTFSYSNQSTSTTIPLEPGLYSIYCWDSYGDGGIAGTVTDSEANVLVSWGTYDYYSFGAFDFNIDSLSSFSLYVNETKDINVMFSPTTNGTITGTLTIYSNDPDEPEYYIALSGEGLVPEIATNPTLINENLFVNETSTQILTIENNGPAGAPDLNAVITIETSAEEYFQSFLQFPQYEQREHIVTERTTNKIKKGYPDKFQQLTGQLDSRSIIFSDDMESGVGGWTTMVYGVDDLWHQTNLSFNSPISSWWCGIEAQGNYATGNTISTALISPSIDLTTISLPVGLYFYESYDTEPGVDFCMVDVTTDGGSNWTPLRGELWYAPSGNSGGWIFTALDLTPFLGNMLQIRFYFDTVDGILNDYAGWFVDDVLVTAGNPLIPWLSVDTNNVTIPSTSTADINVNFDTSGMYGGTYTADIIIASNAPDNPILAVPVTLDLTGIPDIDVTPTSLDFGSLFVGNITTEILTVFSLGTDDLEVTDITSDNPDFYPDITAFNVPPTLNQEVIVTFAPSSVATITGTLTIYSNDPNEPEVYIPLSGVGLAPPEIVVTPANLEEYLLIGESSTQLLNIENTGAADLQFTLSHEYLVEGESSIPRNYGDYADRSRINSSDINFLDEHSASIRKEFTDNRTAGDILGIYTGMPADDVSNMGMVWVGDLLYIVNLMWNQLDVYDIVTQSVIGSYPIHFDCFGITWDGNYLWIGDGYGNVYAYNLDGSSAGFSFSCPFSTYPAISWDGNYFVTCPIFTIDPTIYKLDATGAIIDSYTGSIGMEIYQIVWVPEHTGGNLWMTNTYSNIIAQLDLTDTDGTYTMVNSFTLPPGEIDSYSITHNNSNLWWADWNGPLYEIDDGISEIDWWFGYNPNTGTVPAGTSLDVTCFFVATDLYGGEYDANLFIDTNVPTNPQVIVPVMLDVTGIPVIDVLPVSLDFGAQFAGGTYEDMITIFNYGNDELVVSDITSDNADFSTDVTTLVVPYGETVDVTVYFTPTTIGVISGTLTIYSDDPDEPEFYIALNGEGTEPPVIVVSPASINVDIAPDVIVDNTLTIENIGLVDLNYNISIEYIMPTDRIRNYGDYADRSRINTSEISLPNMHPASMRNSFSENRAAGDVLGTYTGIPNNNTGMVWVGDLLYILDYNSNSINVYDISTQTVIAAYTIHSYPLGITWDGLYLWVGDMFGNVYAYNLDGSSAGFSFSCPVAQYPTLTWDGEYFVTCSIAYYDPIIYKLDATGAVIDSYTGSTGMPLYQIVWVPEHINGNLWITNYETETIAQLDLTDTDGTYTMVSSFTSPDQMWNSSYAITHHNFNLWWGDWDGPLYEIDDGIAEFSWLSIDITSGTLGTGISDNITVTIDANEVDSLGVYEASLVIVSNDPVDPVVYVPVTLTVNYPPEIVLPDDFTFDEDDVLMVDFDAYITDLNSSPYELSVTGNSNVTVDIVGSEVTFGAAPDWYGTETLTFTVDDGQIDSDVVDIIVLPVNDDPTIVLPDDFTFDEDDVLVVDFTQYVDDVDLDVLTLSVTGNIEITVDIDIFEVTFGATENWNGSEILTFIVDDNQGDGVSFTVGKKSTMKMESSNIDNNRATAEDDVEVIVTPVNDEPVLIGFLPEDLTFTVVEDSSVTFSVDVEDIDSTIDYEWFVDDVLQTESTEEFVHIFEVVGDIEIKSVASDEEYEIETIWMVHVEPGSGAGNELLPLITVLSKNFPNPFNPTTTIKFDIKENETGDLSIYNMKGQLVFTKSFGAGHHNFLWDANSCSSGIYFYRLTTPSYSHSRKMILLK